MYSLIMARRIVASEPVPGSAVVLVYCGHNELLKYDEVHDLSKNERALFDMPLVDAPTREEVFAGFEDTIREIVDALT